MNDINEATINFRAILFADDTTLVSSLCSFVSPTEDHSFKNTLSSKINYELHLINEWLSINKLSINVNKTKFMLFHNRQKMLTDVFRS
jgi:hypothetical protein